MAWSDGDDTTAARLSTSETFDDGKFSVPWRSPVRSPPLDEYLKMEY